MIKEKLTREQVEQIWHMSKGELGYFMKDMCKAGFMENPETALEKADRLYRETKVELSPEVLDALTAQRAAIKELKDELEKVGKFYK